MYYFDSLYLLFAVPGLILAFIAQIMVTSRFNRFSKESARSNMTGLDAAKLIASREGYDVDIELISGTLNDHFNPLNNKVALSADNQNSDSVAHITVVAHEFGHVQQKYSSNFLFKFRNGFVPVVNVSTTLGYILFLVGLFLAFTPLTNLGLILFSFASVFALITLPIEFDASRRAMKFIEKYNLISTENRNGAKKVLRAAALTYVASLVQSLGQLLYFIRISRD